MHRLNHTIFTILILEFLSIAVVPLAVYSAEDPLIIGIFPRRNFTTTIKMFTPLVEHLSQKLGIEIKLETARDFPTFWKGVATRHYDLVHYNQYHYVKSHKDFGYQVIVKNEEFGKSELAGSIVARKDSGLTSLQDLKGKKILFGGGPTAMMSYIIPTSLLQRAGIQRNEYSEVYALNPPNAALAIYFGQAAAGGMGKVVLQLPLVRGKIDVSKLFYLAVSEPVSHLPWAVKHTMKTTHRKQLQRVLINLGETIEGRKILDRAKLTGLVVATDDEYDRHRQIIREVLGEKY